ncbi:sepiapterin reductase-like isoform X2 [Argopecten irradians]|uniref:sepiapterin reductase-like isoform X2 n=1 Tax=Argopecten irradians TaxID=31199 RepID=UPI003711D776
MLRNPMCATCIINTREYKYTLSIDRRRATMEKTSQLFRKKSFVAITGGSKGLGRCMALKFAAMFPPNSVLVLMARNVDAMEIVRTEIITLTPNITVIIRQYDQGKTDQGYFDDIFDSVLSENKITKGDFEQVMLVHNCASTGDKDRTGLQHCDGDRVRSYFDINLCGTILLNSSFFKTFYDPSQSRVIINMSSGAGRLPTPSLSLYGTGKAARDMFFRVLSTEEPSVRILTFSPGAVDTVMLQDIEENTASHGLRKVITGLRDDGKLLTPEAAVDNLVDILQAKTFKNEEYIDDHYKLYQKYH